jgi:hypothetical protein
MQSLLDRAEIELRARVEAGASKQVSAGFIKEDISAASAGLAGSGVNISYSGHWQNFPWSQLNRRELEELIAYLKESQT